ncbi:MAG: hypothetical protein ABWX92_11905 [Mycetocola sp.]
MKSDTNVVERLRHSVEPSIRLKVTEPLGVSHDSGSESELREQVRTSHRVATLLSERNETGHIPAHPYSSKWYGAQWVLVALAELGYPPGDRSLVPLRDQITSWLYSPDYLRRSGRMHGLPTLQPLSTATQQ